MSGSFSPRLIKGGIVVLDPRSAKVLRVLSLQYNPDSLTRTLALPAEAAAQDRSQALRLHGPPVESVRLEVEIDATDRLEFPADNANTVDSGLHAELAVLETLVYPGSDALQGNHDLAATGALEIIPMESALTVFVWSKQRAVPVRFTEFSVVEEAFDTALNPIRARVTLAMRVLSVDDLGFAHKGGSLFMSYLKNKEALARKAGTAGFNTLGLQGLP